MDPFAGSLFAPLPKAYASARLSPSLHRQGSHSPMPTRPDSLDDPFFSPNISHSAPIPHTSVPFAPTELAVLQRWSQVYHSHRARCPVGPPPGMPAAVYEIFERLGGTAPFAQTQTADFSQDTLSAPSSQNTTTTLDETEPFRPEAWSSVTANDSQPTPGLYRSPEGDATSVPSSSSPTNTIRSTSSARPAHVFGAGAGVRLGSSPSYGALDQHMRALELKRGMKKSAAGHGRNKTSRTASAPIRGAGGSKPSGSSIRSSPLVGMNSSISSRQSSPLVGLGSGDGQPAYEPMGFQTFGNQPQVQQATVFGATDPQQQSFSFSAGYDADQSCYTEAPSAILDAQGQADDEDGDRSMTPAPTGSTTVSVPPAANAPLAKEKSKVRATVSTTDRTDPNTMPDRNDPSLVIIDDPAALRGMRYEDFEPHMYIGRDALGTEYPRNLEPGAGHERIRCLLCKCGYAGPNGRSMWRRHVSQKHVILLAGKRGTVPKKKEGIPDEAAVINTYMEKRERTLASKKRYASKKRMDQRNDRLAAQGFDASKVAADESKTESQETVDGDEDGDGDDETEEIELEEEPQPMPLQDVPPNSSEGPKPKLRLKPLAKPGEPATGPENALPPSSPLSPVPTTSVSVSPSEPMHPGPTFSFNTPGPINSTYLFSPFDDDNRRGGFGVLGKAFGDDMDSGLGKAFGDEIKLGGVKRVRAFKSTARLDDDAFPMLGVGLSSPLRIGRAQSVGAVEQSPTRGSRVVDFEETGSEPETPRTNAAKVAARRLQLFALESPVANVTPMRRVPPRGALTRSLTTPVMSTKLGSHAALLLGQTPLADGEEELARVLGLAPDIGRHEHSEDSPVRKRKRGPNTPFPIYPSSRLRESMDDLWPPSPFVINTPAPAPKRARKDKNKEEGFGMDSYANEMIAGDLLVEL
ncbi:unnamed protein product [Rhizoctonia solani]|uniref:Uncharacterized protein n=2 Tax=Rhizoctonia solani TaxID=456999 RepID=A0A8H3BFQ9_9AGAM|nr:hypothetical protein V565_109680 [Rhizoctonia solani 123E]CAE6456039.1 unnamed protein product [Rhizoctonia solani]